MAFNSQTPLVPSYATRPLRELLALALKAIFLLITGKATSALRLRAARFRAANPILSPKPPLLELARG
jgi:hypothetical protein